MKSSFVLGKKMPSKQSVVALLKRFVSAESAGSALVEMAITLPVMLAIMTGIFSFSVALWQKEQLAEAVGNGGRQLAVSRGVTDPCQVATNAIYGAAPGLNSSKITLTYTIGTSAATTANSCPSNSSSMTSGGSAEIQASYPCMLNILNIWSKSMVGQCTLYSQVTEVVQ
jgi:Flp pilus assembly protein TadG